MTDAFYGEVRAFGFNYAPVDWAFCNGAKVSEQQNEALHSVIGDVFGSGPGTFNLPNLQGKTVVSADSQRATAWPFAGSGGVAQVTVGLANIPSHTHDMQIAQTRQVADLTALPQTNSRVSSYNQTAPKPARQLSSFQTQYADISLGDSALASFGSVDPQPTSNLQPFLAINFCICVYGVYPSRS